MARKSTLKCNEITKKVPPKYRYEVFIEVDCNEKMAFAECIDVYAHSVVIEGDELCFYEGDGDELIACFQSWCYFVRREKEGELVGSERLPETKTSLCEETEPRD